MFKKADGSIYYSKVLLQSRVEAFLFGVNFDDVQIRHRPYFGMLKSFIDDKVMNEIDDVAEEKFVEHINRLMISLEKNKLKFK
jgi:hypothetical protein